jgi:RNA polymerase sigma-70 factor, ECF subfamily
MSAEAWRGGPGNPALTGDGRDATAPGIAAPCPPTLTQLPGDGEGPAGGRPGPPADQGERGHSDGELLDRFRQGDDDAATQLYRRYAERLRTVAEAQCAQDLASRVDADDILQSVFCSFFRRAARGQYQVPAGEELWRLLVVITLNKIRSTGEFHRARKRDVRATSAGDALLTLVPRERDQGEQAFTELRLLVAELLDRLPEAQQQIVRLRLEGYEVAETAEQSGRSKRTVERVLQDFRRALQGLLGQGDGA